MRRRSFLIQSYFVDFGRVSRGDHQYAYSVGFKPMELHYFFSCRLLCPQTRFVLKLFFYKFAELVQTLDIFIIGLSVGHRGNIEIECGVRADGVEICVKESFKRMSLLGVPIEPARADGHINFRRSEYKTFGIYNIAKRADVLVGVVHIRKVARKRIRIGLYLAERAELGVPVPWGKIETEFQPVAACVGKLSDNIAFAIFIRAVFMQ